MIDEIEGYPKLCLDQLRLTAEAEAIAASTKPTPSELTVEEELKAAGFVHVRTTGFWRSPKFQVYPTAWLAHEMLRAEALDLPEFRIWIEQLKTHYICRPDKEQP
jgi:hypothetical protein